MGKGDDGWMLLTDLQVAGLPAFISGEHENGTARVPADGE